MKFSIKDFFSKCDQIRRKLRIWSHLLKKSLKTSFFVQWLCYMTLHKHPWSYSLVAINSSIVIFFFEKPDFLVITSYLVREGCWITAYATANIPSKLASKNTWTSTRSRTFYTIWYFLVISFLSISLSSYCTTCLQFSLVTHHQMKVLSH